MTQTIKKENIFANALFFNFQTTWQELKDFIKDEETLEINNPNGFSIDERNNEKGFWLQIRKNEDEGAVIQWISWGDYIFDGGEGDWRIIPYYRLNSEFSRQN